ncbi:MAG: hypothetical protein BKP49_08900, partial [Treponema sp. CETP13]
MKHITEKITVIFLIVVILLSASKPSIDGRAIVANEGELPIGLFAKSATYLPGDTVIVTNPTTNTSIEVMIFGSYDSSEGIAIILSPEAAKNLFIEKGSSSIVRITKSNIKDSEPELFSMTSEKKVTDPDIEPMMHVEDSVPYDEDSVNNKISNAEQEIESSTTKLVTTDDKEASVEVQNSEELSMETPSEEGVEENAEKETNIENESFYSPFDDNSKKDEILEETTQNDNRVIVSEEPEITEVPEEEPAIAEEEPAIAEEEPAIAEEEP